VLKRAGPVPSLIERDNDVPDWAVLTAEIDRTRGIMTAVETRRDAECAA
jgi:uncharacterized protein (UPF0276 family)